MDAKRAAGILSAHCDWRRGFSNVRQDPDLVDAALTLAVASLLLHPLDRVDHGIVSTGLKPQAPPRDPRS